MKSFLTSIIEASKSKDFFLAVFVSIVVFISFISYVHFIGAPATQARNIHNEGVRLYDKGKFEEAEEKFEESLNVFYTDETQEYLDLVNSKLENEDN